MDILKNFTNPWESSGAFGSQALGTEVLEGNVLEEINNLNTNSYGTVWYSIGNEVSDKLGKSAINYSKQLFQKNGVTWINFNKFYYQETPEEAFDTVSNIYDAGLVIKEHRLGSYSSGFSSYVTTKEKTDYKEIGFLITHEVTHQYLMRLGWLLWGYKHYLQPHGKTKIISSDGSPYDGCHFNYKKDGSLYLNLMMSGHCHEAKKGIHYLNDSVQKMIPYHKFLMNNYYSIMNLNNPIIANQFVNNFYWEDTIEVSTDNPFPGKFLNLYTKRKMELETMEYSRYSDNLCPFKIDPDINKTITPFEPNLNRQKLYLEEY